MFLANFPALPSCFGGDAFVLLSEVIPPCVPVPYALINKSVLDPTLPCAFEIPTFVQCNDPGVLNQTQFRDGIDNLLYIAEVIEPGFNARLTNSTASYLSGIIPYAAYHTTAAHESAGELTEACFYMTLPNIVAAVVLVAIEAIAGLFVAAIIARAIFASIFMLYHASRAIGATIAGLVGDVDAPPLTRLKKE